MEERVIGIAQFWDENYQEDGQRKNKNNDHVHSDDDEIDHEPELIVDGEEHDFQGFLLFHLLRVELV